MKLDQLKLDIDYFDFDKKFYHISNATPLEKPYLIAFSKSACDLINLDYKECQSDNFIKFVNGEKILKGSIPYAMAYAGHQFGYFVPQLGDGRALNLGSINGWHLQTKGSGITKYSRQGDGRAVLSSSIREFIISEHMHALGIPTTRALALIGSKQKVSRGYFDTQSAAIVLRLSPSWIRIGTFEFFARGKDAQKNLIQLTNYVIKQSYSDLENIENRKQRYEKFFYQLVDKTAKLMAQWMAYGFMHGVMNTDNMSVDGLSIDYGPFAFMDNFEKHCICNHTDIEGRYSFNNQPSIAKWNLEVLAYSLGKICSFPKLMEYLKGFEKIHQKEYLKIINMRLGLDINNCGDSNLELVMDLLSSLELSKCDYNGFFYRLSKLDSLADFSYILDLTIDPKPLHLWLIKYKNVIEQSDQNFKEKQKQMQKINPKYIIKNYMLQEAIENAQNGDFTLVNDLLNIAQNPFDEHKDFEKYTKSTPLEYVNIKLSCSS